DKALKGLENKVWIFGHSRWQGTPGLFFTLGDLSVGDEVAVEARDRVTGAMVSQKFAVDGFFLTDTASGDKLITAADPSQTPPAPVVYLQTSVREDGQGKLWILNREELLAKAKNLVAGDLDDICKYLLLFVTAHPV